MNEQKMAADLIIHLKTTLVHHVLPFPLGPHWFIVLKQSNSSMCAFTRSPHAQADQQTEEETEVIET